MSEMYVFTYSGLTGITQFRKVRGETDAAAHKLAQTAAIEMADVESCASFWAIYDGKSGIQKAFHDFVGRVFAFDSRTDEP